MAAGCASRSTPARYAGDDARDFVEEHREVLEAEIRRGSGPRLYDLAIIANCQDVPQLGRRLHRQQEALLAPVEGSPPGDEAVAERVVEFLTNTRELRCLGLDVSRQGDLAGGTRHIGPTRSEVIRRGGTP